MSKVRAVRLHGVPNDTRVDLLDAPQLTADSVLVQLKAATICANDWKAAMKGSSRLSFPAILGHELAGIVEDVGENVDGYSPGDRVCIRFAGAIYCGRCFFCLRGQNQLCEDWNFFDHPAGWVEKLTFDARLSERLLPIEDNVSFEAAALVEPLACSLVGVEAANIPYGEEVVILGAGPMGLFCLQLALLAGAARAIMVDTVPSRLEKAKELGATDIIDFMATDSVEEVLSMTEGRGAASVIECSGTLKAAQQSIKMARKQGSVVWFAGFPRPADIEIDANEVHYKGLNLTGTSGSTIRHAKKIINYLTSERLDVNPVITHRFKFDQAKEALALAATQTEALKIVLEP